MGWNAILAADLTLPAGGLEAWRAAAFDDRTYTDWGPLTARTPPARKSTVRALLADLAELARAYRSPDLFRLTCEGDEVRVRAFLNEDDYRAIGRDLATALRLAAKVGGRGQYLVLADDGCDGERTVFDGGEGRAEGITLAEVYGGGATGPLDVDYAAVVDGIFGAAAESAPAAPTAKKATKKPGAKKATAKPAKTAKGLKKAR